MQINKKYGGFSLVELMVVFAIVAVMMTLGMTAMISLRNNTLTRQGTNRFIEDILTMRNFARNSTVSNRPFGNNLTLNDDIVLLNISQSIDYWSIIVKDGKYFRGYCDEEQNGIICNYATESIMPENYKILEVKTDNKDCEGILFSFSSGKFTFGSLSDQKFILSNRDSCIYNIIHSQTRFNYSKTELNRRNNYIGLYYGE